MKRLIIFKDEAGGTELTLPVTPAEFEIEHGRDIDTVDMQTVGAVNLPGLPQLLDRPIDCMFPAHEYPFNNPGADTEDPYSYVRRIKDWIDAGTVVRLIVSDTDINLPVLIQSIKYSEKDGTNDVYATLSLRGYRYLTAETSQATVTTAQTPTVNKPRTPAPAAGTGTKTTGTTAKKTAPVKTVYDNVQIVFQGSSKYFGIVRASRKSGKQTLVREFSKSGSFDVPYGTDITFRWYSSARHDSDWWAWNGARRSSALHTMTVHVTSPSIFKVHWKE